MAAGGASRRGLHSPAGIPPGLPSRFDETTGDAGRTRGTASAAGDAGNGVEDRAGCGDLRRHLDRPHLLSGLRQRGILGSGLGFLLVGVSRPFRDQRFSADSARPFPRRPDRRNAGDEGQGDGDRHPALAAGAEPGDRRPGSDPRHGVRRLDGQPAGHAVPGFQRKARGRRRAVRPPVVLVFPRRGAGRRRHVRRTGVLRKPAPGHPPGSPRYLGAGRPSPDLHDAVSLRRLVGFSAGVPAETPEDLTRSATRPSGPRRFDGGIDRRVPAAVPDGPGYPRGLRRRRRGNGPARPVADRGPRSRPGPDARRPGDPGTDPLRRPDMGR